MPMLWLWDGRCLPVESLGQKQRCDLRLYFCLQPGSTNLSLCPPHSMLCRIPASLNAEDAAVDEERIQMGFVGFALTMLVHYSELLMKMQVSQGKAWATGLNFCTLGRNGLSSDPCSSRVSDAFTLQPLQLSLKHRCRHLLIQHNMCCFCACTEAKYPFKVQRPAPGEVVLCCKELRAS